MKSIFCVKLGVGEYDLELGKFNESDFIAIAEICKHPVLIDMLDLHDGSLLDEEEILALGPGILGSVAVYFSLLQKLLVLLIKLLRDLYLLGWVFALVQEKVVVLVLVADLLLEEVFYLLQVG